MGMDTLACTLLTPIAIKLLMLQYQRRALTA